MSKLIIKIALDIPLDRLFDYSLGGNAVEIGQRVVVPFGNRSQIGIVIGFSSTSDLPIEKLKTIIKVFANELPINSETLNLIKFAADYYQYPFGQALLASLPVRLRQVTQVVSRKQYAYQLTECWRNQEIELIPKRQLVARRVFTALKEKALLTEADLDEISSNARKVIKQFVLDGWASSIHVQASNRASDVQSATEPKLNDEQAEAIKQIVQDSHCFKAWLLHGITGSGKTEVYIRLMQHVLSCGDAQVLVLVPEINLTPQLESRFRNRFTNIPLVTLHSNLNDSERLQNWQLAQSGACKIIIGTRLSIFTPLPNLKLIIIDEEHDGSYKQQDSMRYHARDIAIVRAKRLGIPVVMGSATPALESWYNATSNKYNLLSLNKRAVTAAQLPIIECINTNKVNLKNGLTPQLISALKQRLLRKEQSLLFINRRGYSPVLLCSECHWIAPCMRCSSRMVVHLAQQKLCCHHCGHEQRIPYQCPSCGNADLHPTGHGTQRIEQSLAELLPNARIARVDRDSISRKNALVEILDKVHNQEIDILVGTQMLAKGHDFPNLTLVSVIDCDSALYSPDFRASERLFSQLMQVAGRAGRADKAGQVIIQTQFPEHVLFDALRSQDFVSFANAMLQERQQVQFPPYVFMALLRAEANDFQHVQNFLIHAFKLVRGLSAEVMVYDPIRPQMERLKGMERGHILMQTSNRSALQKLLKKLVDQLRGQTISAKVRWAIDVDPLDF